MFALARRGRACAFRCGLATRSVFSEASQVFSAPSMGRWDANCRHGSGAQELVERLEKAFGKAQVSTNKDVLFAHGSDESFHDPSDVLPDVVFSPRNKDEVAEAMKISASLGAPVIPFGVGTSLEGHVAALQGGLSIDFGAHMNQIKEINEEDMDCTVQAGITRVALNEQLKHTGLFFPVDPGADATIGGMVATNASGTSAVKYGTMKQNVLGLRCVLADGTVVNTGSRARKSSSGYDLTSLMVGSEGTLASITDVTLKLHIQPPAVASAVCAFDSTKGAVQTVVSALQYGVPIARAEFLDTQSVQAVHARFPDLGDMLPENRPCLFLEFHGSDHAITEQISVVKELSESNQLASPFQFAHKQEERNALWKARHQAYYAALQLRPGSRGWPTDVCVPISQLASCIEETIEDIHSTGLQAPLFGHIGDGNFHVILLARPDEPTEYLERLVGFNDRLVQRALKAGGTCTGEHGVGYGKRKWMQLEHGKPAVQLMQTIKRALDPEGRMNPGKAI